MTSEPAATLRIAAFAGSDRGRVREGNEDSLYSGSTVYAVADGMGGHRAGEIASETALRPIAAVDGRAFDDPRNASDALRQAVETANATVVREAASNPSYSGMGTTLTAVLVRDGRLHVAHVGDSRAYLLRRGQTLDQLTTDHTLVEELVQEGRLSRDEISTHPQRSVITRAIGVDPDGVDVDVLPPLELQRGDQVLLCSDGLTGPVSDDEIAAILTAPSDGPTAVARLLETANDHGGPDNITVVLLRVDDGDDDGTPDYEATLPIAAPSGGHAGDRRANGSAAAGPAGGVAGDHSPDDRSGGAVATAQTPAGNAPGARAPGASADEADSDSRSAAAQAEAASISIRTRPQSAGHDWARDFGRYGDQQGVDPIAVGAPRGGRLRRVLAGLVGLLVLVAVLGGGAYLLLSRAYFLGDNDGAVAIYNGLPQQVAGVALNRLHETTELAVSDLEVRFQQRVAEGMNVASLSDARRTVEQWQAAAGEPAEPDATSQPRPRPGRTPGSEQSPAP